MNKLLPIAVVAFNAIVFASATHAATADNTMSVSATVARTCTVEADPLAFGTVTEAGSSADATVSITCTAGSTTDTPTVTFSDGLNAASGLRQMIGGDSTSALIPYTLAATSIGENLASTTAVATTAADGGTSYSTTVYGSIAAGTYQIGSFSDTVTVTVTYAP